MTATQQPGKIECPHCGAMIKSPGLAAGAAVNCPKCGKGFRVGAEGVGNRESGVGGNRAAGGAQKSEVAGRRSDAGGRGAEVGRQGSESGGGKPAVEGPRPDARPAPGGRARQPDALVDPNLLPPPPPRAKAKPKEVAVVCKLCGTRTYAPLDRVGQEVKCPDCHSRNVVPPLAGAVKEKKATGPTLEGAEDFGMSEVIERPKYRPMVKPTGEYDVLSALDPASVEHRLTVPGERGGNRESGVGSKGVEGRGQRTEVRDRRSENEAEREELVGTAHPTPPRNRVVVEPVDDEEMPADDEEIVLEPPVERSEAARDPRTILPQPEMEPEDEMYDGRYEGGAIGDGVDPQSPDGWKKAPLVVGIVGFVLEPATLLRLVFYGAWLMAAVMLGRMAIYYAKAEDNSQILALFVIWAGIPVGLAWLVAFASAMHAVIEATANGDEQGVEWPDWNVFEWFGMCRFVLIASLVAALPGIAAGFLTLAASADDPLMAAFGIATPPLLSWLILFPIVLYSQLTEDSVMAVLSGQALRNLKSGADGWVFFYMYGIVIGMVGALAAGMLITGSTLVALLGGLLATALLILFARLTGRLMWYAGDRALEEERQMQASVNRRRLGGTA